ncbi:hypothetical protein [Peterkaempfera sp. SMS 1(5)a]|uniref:MFS transporter small subunit n=1 Tax=Peterkaempfera podocarpi TaxID=3232308 RepID=UPI0036721A81
MSAQEETAQDMTAQPDQVRRRGLLVLVWLWVAAPFGYGVYELALKLRQLFGN